MTHEPSPDKDTSNRGYGAVKAVKTVMIGDWIHAREGQEGSWNYMVSELKVNTHYKYHYTGDALHGCLLEVVLILANLS